MAARRSLSMQTRNAARVLPEPVGAEMRVGSPRRMAGQPAICGSVAEPNFVVNHSCTTGVRPGESPVDCNGFQQLGHA